MASLLVTDDGLFTNEGRAELPKLVARLSAQDEPKLLLHVHGGLVSDQAGRAIATALDQPGAFGGLADAGWERSYLIWRTGLFEALDDRFKKLAGDELFNRLVDQVLKWAGARVLEGMTARGQLPDGEVSAERAIPGEPFSDRAVRSPEEIATAISSSEAALAQEEGEAAPPDDELRRAVEGDRRVGALAKRLETELQRREEPAVSRGPTDGDAAEMLALLDDDVLAEAGAETFEGEARGAITGAVLSAIGRRALVAGYRVLKRFLKGRDHGLYCTVVEEVGRAFYIGAIGAGIWGDMKSDAEAHFNAGGAGAAVLSALDGLARQKGDVPVHVLITAHSAGAILACHLVAAARTLPANVRLDLVFLAPAVRVDFAALSVAAAGAKVAGLRIFTMKDELEQSDDLDRTIAGKLYPRSLLYLVSGLFETLEDKSYADAPLLGLQRHMDLLKSDRLSSVEKAARDGVLLFLQSKPSRWILSEASGGDGLNTRSHTHGSFDRDPPTLASVVHIAKRGY